MSCDSQDSTIQRSSPHKCDQKSSCNAFNVVVAAFSFGVLVWHVPINGASWRAILVAKIHVWTALIRSEEGFILGSPSICPFLMRLQIGISYNYSSLLGSPKRPQTEPKTHRMVLGSYPYNSPSKFQFFPLIWGEKVGFWFLGDKTN